MTSIYYVKTKKMKKQENPLLFLGLSAALMSSLPLLPVIAYDFINPNSSIKYINHTEKNCKNKNHDFCKIDNLESKALFKH